MACLLHSFLLRPPAKVNSYAWKQLLQIRRHFKLRIGEKLPEISLFENTPDDAIETVNLAELYKNKKGVLFSVVGAFTPGCSNAHIPEYINHFDTFKNAGYDLIACVSVNDPFVMAAWSQETNAEGKIKMLADPRGEFTKAIGMELDCSKMLGNIRSKRYSLVVENNVIRSINLDPDHSGLFQLVYSPSISWTQQNIKENTRTKCI